MIQRRNNALATNAIHANDFGVEMRRLAFMKQLDWGSFSVGFGACMLYCMLVTWLIDKFKRTYRRCTVCKKRYWEKNSSCVKFKALFCSEECMKFGAFDYLIKEGCPPEIAIQ